MRWSHRLSVAPPKTPQSAQTSGTTMVRPVTNSKSRELELSRIRRNQGKRSWR